MDEFSEQFKYFMILQGASLVGFGSLSEIPPGYREDLPVGVSVAVRYPKDVIRGITELPTINYRKWYDMLGTQLDEMVTIGAQELQNLGYKAVAMTREYVNETADGDINININETGARLPHKTIATRAGLGWIGRNSLLITKEFGPMVRLSSILTDAPLSVAAPINKSKCGICRACRKACPAGAISGVKWKPGIPIEAMFHVDSCAAASAERSMLGFHDDSVPLCGKCVESCMITKRYMNSSFE